MDVKTIFFSILVVGVLVVLAFLLPDVVDFKTIAAVLTALLIVGGFVKREVVGDLLKTAASKFGIGTAKNDQKPTE